MIDKAIVIYDRLSKAILKAKTVEGAPLMIASALRLLILFLFSTCGGLGIAQDISQASPELAPQQARTAGFNTLVFRDYFKSLYLNDTDRGATWHQGYWFAGFRPSYFSIIPGTGLELTDDVDTGSRGTILVSHPRDKLSGGGAKSFMFGYFEARMRFSSPNGNVVNNFGSFYLYSLNYLEQTDGYPGTEEWCELDVFEGTGSHFQSSHEVHDWTQPHGGSMAGVAHPNALQTISIDPIDGNWHIFGMLWQKNSASFYIDDTLIITVVTYPVCNTQPAVLVLQAGTHTTDTQTTEVAWVKVWQ